MVILELISPFKSVGASLPVSLMNRNVRFREADLGRVSMKLR